MKKTFTEQVLQENELIQEGWAGGLIGFILGNIPSAITSAVASGATTAITKNPLAGFLTGMGVGTATQIGSAVIGHKIEEWGRYKNRVTTTRCNSKSPGEDRARCVIAGLKQAIRELESMSKKVKSKGLMSEYNAIEKKIIRFNKDIAKYEDMLSKGKFKKDKH